MGAVAKAQQWSVSERQQQGAEDLCILSYTVVLYSDFLSAPVSVKEASATNQAA